MTVSEYIRNRRLSLACRDLRIDGTKVIDVAMKYGYDSPDSFANTLAVFTCRGPMPSSMQEVYQKIFKEWLPGNPDFELAGMYNIEYYTDCSKLPKGNQDENYYSELWFPVKAK